MSEINQTPEVLETEGTLQGQSAPAEETVNGEQPSEERDLEAERLQAVEQRAKELRENAAEQQLRNQVLQHPLVKEAMSLLEKTRFDRDLARVKEAYPGLTAKSPKEVGEIYCRLMASGQVDPVVAYEAQVAADRRREPIPENMVSAKSTGGTNLYYSSQELDRLTEKDLKDPNIFKKAMLSLSKLRS